MLLAPGLHPLVPSRVGHVGQCFAEHLTGLYESRLLLFEADFPMDEESFAFGSFHLIPAQRVLLEDGKPLRLGSRALDILIALVESAGEIIGKYQLIARTWPDAVVDEGALRVHVAALRKALGDGRDGMRYIANVPGRATALPRLWRGSSGGPASPRTKRRWAAVCPRRSRGSSDGTASSRG